VLSVHDNHQGSRFTPNRVAFAPSPSSVPSSSSPKASPTYAIHPAFFGLRWLRLGSARPSYGTELDSKALSQALLAKSEFSKEEWEAFGVYGLRDDHFINSGGVYFKPTVLNGIIVDATAGSGSQTFPNPSKINLPPIRATASATRGAEHPVGSPSVHSSVHTTVSYPDSEFFKCARPVSAMSVPIVASTSKVVG